MTDDSNTPGDREDAAPPEERLGPAQEKARPIAPAERKEIVRLKALGFGTRPIAKKLQRSRAVVRRVLQEEGLLRRTSGKVIPPPQRASKLDPFRELIREKVAKGLTTRRILREIRAEGYQGGRTILGKYVASIRAPLRPKPKVTRRFETAPGEEMQLDWSSYRLLIGGKWTLAHALAVILGHSRLGFLEFFESERLPHLLEGLTHAFEYFEGCAGRGVSDNMTTVVLGRIGRDRKPIWNPRYLDFTRHYGYEPYLCRISDPNRKGEVENFLYYAERDLVRGLEPESFVDLNNTTRYWLDEVANKRKHGTTGRVPREAWLHERDFLIRLPETRFAGIAQEEVRRVGQDSTLSIRGTLYTVPVRLANRTVSVRLFSSHFEVLDPSGGVALSRPYVAAEDHGKLQLDPDHYSDLPWPSRTRDGGARSLEDAFLASYPALADLLDGIRLRMKTLWHVHVRILLRLADLYGPEPFLAAATRAQEARLFNANAVQRILERECPLGPDEHPILPLGEAARVTSLLGDVEPGTLDSYGHLDAVSDEEDEGDGSPQEAPHGRHGG